MPAVVDGTVQRPFACRSTVLWPVLLLLESRVVVLNFGRLVKSNVEKL